MSASRYDAIVIGAGPNGLAAAATLARKHGKVLVLERADEIGGQARLFEVAPGVRAPLGPDVGWVSRSVARGVGVRMPATTAPSTSITVRDGDGFFALPVDVRAAADAIRPRSARDAERWPAFVTRLHRLAGFLGAMYESPPPDVSTTSLSDLATLLGLGRRFRALGRADMTELLRILPMSAQDFLDDELEATTLKAAVGAGGVRDLRQGPRSGGTTFNMLHYLVGAPIGSVRARAWWTPSPDAFILAAEESARKRHVQVRTGAAVARITVRDDAVSGVVLANGDELSSPLVLSTADPRHTILQLADPVWLDPEFLRDASNIKLRGTTAIIAYALDALPVAPGLGERELAGIVSLSSSLDAIEQAYDCVKYGEASPTPHVELSAVSLRWPSLAPDGRHVVVARAQYAPSRSDQREAFADAVTRVIAGAIPGFAERVTHRRALMPNDLAETYGVSEGALTHGELTLDQILFMRPIAGFGRYAMPVDGLYLGGTGTNPGPGLPGAAGWLAARAALG
jgi:phytoene dehydrogenase-like protein